MRYRNQRHSRLIPCSRHGADAELFLVEGDSAADSVAAVRNVQSQAVLALQGKPMNAWKATAARVASNTLFTQIGAAFGFGGVGAGTALANLETAQLPALRFGRIVLLFDPDADGIHIGALMMLYFAKWATVLLDSGRVQVVRMPMFELLDPVTGEVHHAMTPEHRERLALHVRQQSGSAPMQRSFRGLGNVPPEVLRHHGVDPATRSAMRVTRDDVAQVIELFGLIAPERHAPDRSATGRPATDRSAMERRETDRSATDSSVTARPATGRSATGRL